MHTHHLLLILILLLVGWSSDSDIASSTEDFVESMDLVHS